MPDLLDTLARALGDRYAIEGEIGRGGMAAVFRARDVRHGRSVALKVMDPDLSAGLGPERFLREIRIAANLQHPHIVPLYDSGEAEGLLYFVMPYLDGESLAERIRREGALPVDDVVGIGCEVADALDYAHRSGVVHRDVKPANILLSGGHAYVADFGIGAAVQVGGEVGLTQTGSMVGTPAYMSPEQADGVELDGRSDVYGLGCVLYEMLTGLGPFDAPTPMAILVRKASGEVVMPRERRADVPAGVEAIVMRALAREREDRFASSRALGAALKEGLLDTGELAVARASSPSIAVLPFTNMSANPENEYFSDGMAEEIINALAKLPELKVAARTSTFTFKGENVDLRKVGERLGVSTVLEGSVRQSGTKLRVTAQLVAVKDGFRLWSQRYDREMTDVFAIQDELAAAIVEQLEVELAPAQRSAPLVKRGTQDLEAYHLYLKGRHLWERRQLKEALACFEGAVARDPDYALAHAGLADGYSALGYYGFVPAPVARAKAAESAARAMAADPDLMESRAASAMVAWFFEYDAEAAVAALERAIEADPRSAYALSGLAWILGTLGRIDEVRSLAARALELDALSAHVARMSGLGFSFVGEHEIALRLCQRALDLDPGSAVELFARGFTCARMGHYDEAVRDLSPAVQLIPAPFYVSVLGWTHALAGRVEEARGVLEQLRSRGQGEYGAWIEVALGDYDTAFQSIESLFLQRAPIGLYFVHWSEWAEVRADPRYAAIVEKAGLTHLLPRSA